MAILTSIRLVSLAGYAGTDGGDWQRLFLSVLREEHRDDLIPVPDHDRGDAGLEAYTLTGSAFQCYSPQEPLSTGQRYAKQRDKMTVDVGKFIVNGPKLRPMFGTTKIKQWVLLVPVIDSRDLLKHATAQTARVRAAGLDYVDNEIHVVARDIEHTREACTRSSTDSYRSSTCRAGRARLRSRDRRPRRDHDDALYEANKKSDRDKDGIACEA